ncbi:hypothetical protein [Winogradskyella alexanderae]|uniref:Lipoprotein n=1 Tax=Winogradskyella alexanderae TaxID=2877123 RepID=A0ABS7XQL3_9FLAO|nr:hypothetical protein [Winogradskyella alexanderae]MCA0131331.1 hypothetical protein [Winogradskyella alexanderae]
MNKLLKTAWTLGILLTVSLLYHCGSPKTATVFQEQTEFKIKKVYFQEWYAGIDVGGTGVNIFVPVANKPDYIQIDSVFFRNLKGKLEEKGGRYTAILKNKSKEYVFNPNYNSSQYPFKIRNNECVISYVEKGEIKYLKVQQPKEFAGTYYENGAPSKYSRPKADGLATLDIENDN